MARIDLDTATLAAFEDRVSALPVEAHRQWGTMSVAQMLAHLRIVLEISLEERETTDESRPWLMPLLWVLLFELWTRWPRGRIQASQQFLDGDATDVEAERTAVLAAMGRFVAQAEAEPDRVVLEPMLGRIPLRKWRRVHGVHTDYHLRQFGG